MLTLYYVVVCADLVGQSNELMKLVALPHNPSVKDEVSAIVDRSGCACSRCPTDVRAVCSGRSEGPYSIREEWAAVREIVAPPEERSI